MGEALDGEHLCAVSLDGGTCVRRLAVDVDSAHAPHEDVSQPMLVPVSLSCSRKNCTSSVRGSTSPLRAAPLTVSEDLSPDSLVDPGHAGRLLAAPRLAPGRWRP